MSIAEYYYPLATLDVRTNNGKKYFVDASNTKINFATNNGNVLIEGSASEYYINTINADTDKTKVGNATKYLVIKHKVAGTCMTADNCEKINGSSVYTPKPFYVAFPLYVGRKEEDISRHLQSDRMNGRLAESINNLQKTTVDTKSVQFSLESVINSMKSFAPTGYYKLAETATQKKIYVMNKPIYLKNLDTSSFYEGDIVIPSNLGELTNVNMNRVKVTRTCSKPKSSKKPTTYKSMFYGLAKKEQVRIDYLNLIYGLSTFIFTVVFYYIYNKYMVNEWKTVLYGIIIALGLVVIPIGITKSVYETKSGKVNLQDLQHSIIFARFFVLGFLCSIVIIFGATAIKTFFVNNFNYDAARLMMAKAFTNWTKETWIILLNLIFLWVLISWSIYIFLPNPNERLL